MKSSYPWMKSVVIPLLLLAACGPATFDADSPELVLKQQAEVEEGPNEMVVSNKVLILASTVFNGTNSQEAVAARSFGMTVEVVTPIQWGAKTAADFATYRAIILGDAKCVSLTAINAAMANRNVWGPMINGNVIVVGTSPALHTGSSSVPGPLTKDSIAFALAQPNKTGAYISLSCYYATAPTPTTPPGTAVQLLEPFGTFTVLSPSGCYNTAHITSTFLTASAITDANLSNWGCSAKEVFDTYPTANFAPLVIAKDPATGAPFPGSKTMPDDTHGPVYVLAKGATPFNCGNGVVDATEECDNGSENGATGNACSAACRLNWCGDGVRDPSEQCDLGASNGNTSTCSASCQAISTNRPPVLRCPPPISIPTPPDSCGACPVIGYVASDPDGNLLNCTVSPPCPYGLGTTSVTVTCRDTGGLTSTCTIPVTVYDNVPPHLVCPPDITAECTNGRACVELPDPVWALDNCDPVDMILPGEHCFPLGTSEVQYTARDRAGNTSQCMDPTRTTLQPIHVTVRDTLGPVVTPNGSSRMQLECGADTYTELGATANDQCYGDASNTITISGSVDTGTRGRYMITYSATDPEGHAGEGYREVMVADTAPPSITLSGPNPEPLECGIDRYTELGAAAWDSCSGDLTPFIRIDSRAVNPSSVGSYPVSYSVSDAREWRTEATRTVVVVDHTPPVITCPAPTAAECVGGVAIVDPGPAQAADACALASVSPNLPATYPIGTTSVGYTATDRAGHTSTCSTPVTVFDSLPPSVELLGDAAPVLECGVDPYVEAGATAVDVCYGDITSRLVRTGLVNPHAEGLYEIDYSAMDLAGNLSNVARRQVRVHDTRSPKLQLEGANPMQLECDRNAPPWVDPGAVATDSCSGDLTAQIVKHGTVDTRNPGVYPVVYDVTDGAGLSDSKTRTVHVVMDPPQIIVRPSAELWPPNHHMYSFRLSDCAAVNVTCGPPLNLDQNGRITQIYSDEPEDGLGDGDTAQDIVITGPSSFQLRGERQGGGTGRAYGVDFDVRDNSGATVGHGFCRFLVPHDGSGRPVIDEGPSAGYTVSAR
jgi:hypothetical protein